MSNEVMDTEAVIMNETIIPGISAGASLKQARESLGLTLEEVALQLHLSPVMVDALERDAIERLPGFTFVRGYLRAYAKVLNLPPDQVIAVFNATYPQTAQSFTSPAVPARRTQKMVIKKKRSNENLVRWVGYIIAAVLVVLVFIWWHNHTTMMDEAISHQAAKPLPAADMVASPATDNTTAEAAPSTTASISAAGMQPVGPASSAQSQMDVTNPIAASVANTAANVPGLQPTASVSPLTTTSADKTVNAAQTAANAAAVPGLAPAISAPVPSTPAKNRVANKAGWKNPDAN